MPGYGLTVETARRDGEPMLRMTRINGKDGAEAALKADGGSRAPLPAPPAPAPAHAPPQQAKPGRSGAGGEPIDAAALVRGAVFGLSDKATRGLITPETIAHLRETRPGWNLDALHAEFESWVAGDPERTPANWQRAFIGFVKRHHERNRHSLRR